MHIFIAGSTGVLGRRIVRLLVDDSHRVTALTRDAARAGQLSGLGARPVVGDARRRPDVVRAIDAAAPDVVMNQLTDLRGGIGPANAALRVASSQNLAWAARAAGVRRVVAQSIAWAYGPGERPAQEDDPLDVSAAGGRGESVRAVHTLEEATATAPEWVVLRYGLLYGPDTWYEPGGERADAARAGALPADGDVTSFVHVDDAARAAVAALTWPSGAVNVCDDEPAPGAVWVPAFGAAVGATVPASTPAPAGTAGRHGWARGADNTWLRSGLRFDLRHPSWRAGFASLARSGGSGAAGPAGGSGAAGPAGGSGAAGPAGGSGAASGAGPASAGGRPR